MSDFDIADDAERPEPPDTPAHNRVIYQPSLPETAIFSQQRQRTCGMCKFFRHDEGQRRLFREKRLLEIVHDYGWKTKHMGDDPRRLAVCSQHDDMLVGPNTFGCEHFKVK
jgi:hypothetical protein